jgi:S1-C subfamily serine protease
VDRVPPLQPGDPGDGHGEDHHDADDVAYVPPLPPEDRLWRHPSEVASGRPVAPPTPAPTRFDRRTAVLLVASGVVGATLAVGGVVALGGFDERVVERQVAVQASSASAEGPNGAEVVADRTAPSVAALVVHRAGRSSPASAVALRSDGYLVTDGPAVDGADAIDVLLHDGTVGAARIVGADDVTGIAVLHVDALLEGAVLADDEHRLDVGERTVAVAASPDGGWDLTVSSGVVSAVDRRLEAPGATRHGMILVDKALPPDAAGGALVDGAGVVVGIVSGTNATGGGMSFGVATPIDIARHVADQLVEHGRATHVWLGLHGTDLGIDQAAERGLVGGALVEDVDDDGPARLAGVMPGDVVVSVDGQATPTMSALIAALRRHLPGDVVELTVDRDGATRRLQVTLAAKG